MKKIEPSALRVDLHNLRKLLSERAIASPQRFFENIERYCKLILEWNERASLVSKKDERSLVSAHIQDSLSILAIEPDLKGKRLLDIGTGAGFPGLVLKIWESDLDVVLLESVRKKTLFLRKAIEELNLERVEVVHCRYRDYNPKERFDMITLRALGNPYSFLSRAPILLKPFGKLIHFTTERRFRTEGKMRSESIESSDSVGDFTSFTRKVAWGRGILRVYEHMD